MSRPWQGPTGPLTVIAVALIAILAVFGPDPARAQERVDIRFDPGRTGTTINGAIIGDEYIDYVLRIGAGQMLDVTLTVTGTNGAGAAYFNILPAGRDYDALFVGASEGRSARVTVPRAGDWAIRVYLMGNDRDAGRTVGYSVDVTIPPAGGAGGGSSSAGGGTLPEEDFFIVRLSSADGRLNVRDAPRASAAKLGEVRNGTVLQNVGGCVISDGAQWCNVQPSQGGVRGWVSARFLGLPGPGGGSAASPPPAGGGAKTVQVAGVPANDVLNVRSGPGTGNRIVGALANGDRVREIGCRAVGSATWCEIEMMTDMRERGWVNASFLKPAGGGGANAAADAFDAMVGPCRRQAARLTGVARADVHVADRIQTGGGPILILNAGGAKYTCRREPDGSVTVFSEYAN